VLCCATHCVFECARCQHSAARLSVRPPSTMMSSLLLLVVAVVVVLMLMMLLLLLWS
jgi:hypothetical protein